MDLAQPRKVEIEVDGETLTHYLRELPSTEWLAWQRKIGELNGQSDTLAQVMLWYDEHIVKVAGYTYGEVDLMVARAPRDPTDRSDPTDPTDRARDWRSLIPGAHKLAAWTESVTGDNLKKKLLATSKDSTTPSGAAPEK